MTEETRRSKPERIRVEIEVDERTLSALQAAAGKEHPPTEEDIEAFLYAALASVAGDESSVH